MKYFLTFITLLSTISLFGNNIKIRVVDESSSILAYSDIYINNRWHILTDSIGIATIKSSICEIGDTLKISYMGYEKKEVIITSHILKSQEIQNFQLTPKSYNLSDITIEKKDFNSENFFSKKKQSMLLPYSDKYMISANAQVTYTDISGSFQKISGKIKILFHSRTPEIIENNFTTDSVLINAILSSIKLTFYIPYSFCFKKIRKMYNTRYLGINNNNWTFIFNLKPEYITNPYFKLQKGDEISNLVSMNKDGFINKIETNTIIRSGKSRSYILNADYISYKDQMVPIYISNTLLNLNSNKKEIHIELKEE